MFKPQVWRSIVKRNAEKNGAPQLNRKRDLLLAFVIVSLPFLAIASLLIGFIFNTSERYRPDYSVETPDLPVNYGDISDAYLTGISPGSFLLVGSWSSNIAEFVVAPFIVIFSYAATREIFQASIKNGMTSGVPPPSLRDIIRGAHGKSRRISSSL